MLLSQLTDVCFEQQHEHELVITEAQADLYVCNVYEFI